MMQRFSDRIGITSIPDVMQSDNMTPPLRNSLWNHLLHTVLVGDSMCHSDVIEPICEFFFKLPLDSLPAYRAHEKWLRSQFFSEHLPWFQVYNLIEFVAIHCGEMRNHLNTEKFSAGVNVILEREMSGYRFIGGVLAPITNPSEIQSISSAAQTAAEKALSGTQQHLHSAVLLLSKKPAPDYRNAIKESISAIESLTKQITGEKSGGLDRALGQLDATAKFHKAFRAGLLSLYGFTSDDSGIRHAILEEPQVGFDEAKFMLVTCSALVNFMIAKADRAGLLEREAQSEN